ncbi:hypothetical protein [Streptomyces sp. NPDC091027]|uniref:hypothetical protein n=1 Tax=Streptomyces sp. NPDC091027 TaxID=3365971 RepID=UPI0037FBE116
MSNATQVPVDRIAICFTGEIVVTASLMNCEGKVRTTEDVVREVITDMESAIHNHLMYSDEAREEYDLVQEIVELDIEETTSVVGVVSEAVRDFESGTSQESWSEHDECEAMARELIRLGLKAENASTGGGCWAVYIRLNDKDALCVTTWPDWAWSLEREGEQLLAGDWGVSDIPRAAEHVKKLVEGLGNVPA